MSGIAGDVLGDVLRCLSVLHRPLTFFCRMPAVLMRAAPSAGPAGSQRGATCRPPQGWRLPGARHPAKPCTRRRTDCTYTMRGASGSPHKHVCKHPRLSQATRPAAARTQHA